MKTIIGRSSDFPQSLETALAEYRYKIFIDRLGWELPARDGMERDQFDHAGALYVVGQEPSGAICGCARLLPTTAPYLLSEIFPYVLNGQPVPRSPEVWELSRFAAAPLAVDAALDSADNARCLLAAAVRAAKEHGAARLITVSPLGVERLLHRMGVHAHRAGPPVLVDGKPVFACWIEIDAQTCGALGASETGAGKRTPALALRAFPARRNAGLSVL